jgi:hypothetical protein
VIGAALLGCGTTREKLATEQMLLSDAVDRAVARIDFSPLRNEKVYLDTTYLKQIKGTAFVNADYIISSLRQQMVLAGCLLQENRDDATYIAEARVGVLGSDAHDVNYGVPGSNGLTAAASLVGGAAPLPSLPEISFARKTDDSAATKVAVFAYHRETRRPVWQSGLSVARSRAQAKWLLGAGPFRSGSIYDGTEFVGPQLRNPLRSVPPEELSGNDQSYRNAAVLDPALQDKLDRNDSGVQIAEHSARTEATAVQPAAAAAERGSGEQSAESKVERADYVAELPDESRPDTEAADRYNDETESQETSDPPDN